jgi:carbohydrate kinase (thermoresistant glucokinase family)
MLQIERAHALSDHTVTTEPRIVVMGVSGCGKTTLANALGAAFTWDVLDADDLHPLSNIAKMRDGVPLTDADRHPWLRAVGSALASPLAGVSGRVVACSALKRAYRDQLRAIVPGVQFLFLHGAFDAITARMNQREGHYMPSSLLETQFQTLEAPGSDEPDVLPISLMLSVEQVVAQLQQHWSP